MRIVMRTAATTRSDGSHYPQGPSAQHYRFTPPIKILLAAGADASPRPVTIDLDGESARFREIILDIPADQVRSDELEITVGGDHPSYGYWFYQPPAPSRSQS